MSTFANPVVQPPDVNLQYYEQTGRPLIGDPEQMTVGEFTAQAHTVIRGCYGTFDTAIPSMTQFGRTYHEVLSYAATQEFRIFTPPVLRWVRSERYGVRPLVFVQWIEFSKATKSTIRNKLQPHRFMRGSRGKRK